MTSTLIRVGCLPLLGAGFIPLLPPLIASFKPLHEGWLRPLKLLVTLHITRIEIDSELQIIAMQTTVSAYSPAAPKHPTLVEEQIEYQARLRSILTLLSRA